MIYSLRSNFAHVRCAHPCVGCILLQLIQSWSVNHTNHIPITIYLEPREATLFAGNEASINQQLASAPANPRAETSTAAVTGM